MRLAFLAVTAAALVLVACGDDDDNTTPTPSTAENSVAASVILQLADAPPGWGAAPATNHSPFDQCNEPLAGRTGTADGEDFSNADGAMLFQSAAVFANDGAASEGLKEYANERVECFAEAINLGFADPDEVDYGDAKVDGFDFPKTADESQAKRVTFSGTSKKDNAKKTFYYEVVVLRKGRIATSLVAQDDASPIADLDDWAERAENKLP